MSPDVIICDEIGGRGDEASIISGINAGVVMIATAHALTFEELLNRRNMADILKSGAFPWIVLMDNIKNVGRIKEIVRYDQIHRTVVNVSDFSRNGLSFI